MSRWQVHGSNGRELEIRVLAIFDDPIALLDWAMARLADSDELHIRNVVEFSGPGDWRVTACYARWDAVSVALVALAYPKACFPRLGAETGE